MGFNSRSSNSQTRMCPGSCTSHSEVEMLWGGVLKPSAFIPNKSLIIATLKIFCTLCKPCFHARK